MVKVYKISDNILKYRFGVPFPTDVVVKAGKEIEKSSVDYFQIKEKEELKLIYKMDTKDIVFGLGENQRGLNKRGGEYISFCSDDPNHTPEKRSLYGAHNFLLVDGVENFGVFIDYPGKVVFDIGFSHKDYLEITIEDKNFDLYIIDGSSSREIVSSFLNIIGEGYVPPKWAFGYQQSRWSYPDAKEVEKIADRFIENNIPCDAIYLDIDYMEDYKNFTVSEERFPNFKRFVEKMKDKGFRLIPIIDAGVKIEEGYDIYEEGVEKGYFCVDIKGQPFVAAVWPGKVHFPDFLNNESRLWFGKKYGKLIDCGLEGFWNDMNEPAIFYTNRGIEQAIEEAKNAEGKNLNIDSFFGLKDEFRNISNNIEDYKSFYHNIDGKLVNHYDVHNLYGYNMTRSADEGFKEIYPNKRFLLISRSSYIGMHRYSGIWTGDNHSWWEHILLNIKMMPSLNMCGFLYSGADTGGFSGDINGELAIRWTQFSIFTPLFRNHSAKGTRHQEPFAFDEESNLNMKEAIKLRYGLIPYIYSEYMKAIINKDIYFAPISFEYNDEYSRRVEDQLLVGDSLMISPIYEENSRGRYIWLPEDMLLWKAKDYSERKYEIIEKGHRYLNIDIDEIPIFIRKNRVLVLGKHANTVDNIDNQELVVIAFVEDKASYTYYDDDGKSLDYRDGIYSKLIIEIEKRENDYNINVKSHGNKEIKRLKLEIIDREGKVTKKTVNIQ